MSAAEPKFLIVDANGTNNVIPLIEEHQERRSQERAMNVARLAAKAARKPASNALH